MPSFSNQSTKKLDTCHSDLQAIFNDVIQKRDCTIIEGYRERERQEEMYRTGKSKLRFPDSNHNAFPSMAVDVMEYFPEQPHIHWADKDGIEDFANFVLATAKRLLERGEISHTVRWGGDWDRDGVRVDHDPDERFFDGPHFELA